MPFASNRGRIRLQDSPEGTIVQWTFSYELKGFMSGLRNTLGVKGGIDKNIVDGLRNLYTHIKSLKADDETFIPEESKSYLRAAPDVSARSQYQPRYPSVLDSNIPKAAPISQAPTLKAQEMASLPSIGKPPIADDDTHPNRVIEPAAKIFAPKPVQSDSFVPKTIQAEPLPSFDEPIEEETVTSPKPALTDTAPQVSISSVEEASSPAVESLTLGRDVDKMDTAKISVFELFGLDKPSETEKVVTISEKPADPAPSVAFSDPTPIKPDIEPEAPRRRGLRAALRRKLTNVRRPK